MKVKCICDNGCPFWTEGNEYPAKFYIVGGLDYLAQFELLDSGE